MSTNTTQPQPCTVNTCPASMGMVGYQPTLVGNALLAAIYGVMLLAQLAIGIQRKTWTYLVAMTLGLVLEVVGYVGRIQLHDDYFNFDAFVQYLVCLTIGPALLTAAIYITFTRIVRSCDESLSFVQPKKVSIIFMTFDFICLVLQATGGAITATSNGLTEEATSMRQTGVDIMIGGLAFHVVSLFFFMTYAASYAWRYRAATAQRSRHRSQHQQGTLRFRLLVTGITIASLTIFARCCYRVAELREGFDSSLAHDEVAFMVLEGAMIIIASLCLTICHPGFCLDIPWKAQKQGSRSYSDDASYVDLANIHTAK